MLNLMNTVPIYAHIIHMNRARGSLHKEVSGVYTSSSLNTD